MSITARSRSRSETLRHEAYSSAFIMAKLLKRLMILSMVPN